jgi:hypothetical protein
LSDGSFISRVGCTVSTDDARLAILLKPIQASFAFAAGIDHASYAYQLTNREVVDGGTYTANTADNFVPGNKRILGGAPFPPRSVHVGVAQSAILDRYLNVVFLGRTPGHGQRDETAVTGPCAVTGSQPLLLPLAAIRDMQRLGKGR